MVDPPQVVPTRHGGPLRVVVVVDNPVVPAAVARAIERVVGAPVDLLGVHVHRRPATLRGRPDLAALIDRADRAFFRPTPDALELVDLRRSYPDLLDGTKTSIDDRDVPDVVLDLTLDGLRPGEAVCPPMGVWSLRYGQDQLPLGRAFLPEYLSGSDLAVCELVANHSAHGQHLEAGAAEPRSIYRSVGVVDPYSPARTRNAAAWKSAEFPARALTALAAGGPTVIVDRAPARGPAPAHVQRLPAWSIAAIVGRVLARGFREAVRRTMAQPRWFVAVRFGRSETAADTGFDTQGFRPLVPPPGRFYADPFVVDAPDGAFVFVEDGPVDGGAARLSVVELNRDGAQRAPARVVLERSSHLSYPFVFRDDGNWYMLPETAGTSTVELLRAKEFPWSWEPCAVLLRDVRAWDPTLLRHNGRYWLFLTTAAPGARPSDELSLYSAPGLTGPWLPHPLNPIVSDARRARPAGRILARDGSLIRPAQDASGGYGSRIVLNRIDVITLEDYHETPIGTVEPGWLPGVVRTHTYTADGEVEALDGVRYERRSWRGWPWRPSA